MHEHLRAGSIDNEGNAIEFFELLEDSEILGLAPEKLSGPALFAKSVPASISQVKRCHKDRPSIVVLEYIIIYTITIYSSWMYSGI